MPQTKNSTNTRADVVKRVKLFNHKTVRIQGHLVYQMNNSYFQNTIYLLYLNSRNFQLVMIKKEIIHYDLKNVLSRNINLCVFLKN